ncbi:MAG TPA: 16S rRNA (cytosine(1402)-N(4))-methyltransferase RsmH [Candidatus Kapabacteria bacterium]
MASEHYHTPVLLAEAVDALAIKADGIYVDATLGGGGYTEAIAEHLADGKVYSFDTDPNAIAFASERLQRFGERVVIVRENFRQIQNALAERGVKSVNGIVYDLGISSRQIDTTSIGLSYRFESELDMRLDPRLERTAKDIIADYDEYELKKVFRDYGEEPFSGRIARWIVEDRKKGPIETTVHLAQVATRGIREDKKSAVLARIFQALRIEVNDELGALRESLFGAMEVLAPEGRLVVVSYHSLEDRIVKEFFNTLAKPLTEAGSAKSLMMAIDDENATLSLITRKPAIASEEEVARNPRARSAKMRVAEKR